MELERENDSKDKTRGSKMSEKKEGRLRSFFSIKGVK
jgi:hypothetical protein